MYKLQRGSLRVRKQQIKRAISNCTPSRSFECQLRFLQVLRELLSNKEIEIVKSLKIIALY